MFESLPLILQCFSFQHGTYGSLEAAGLKSVRVARTYAKPIRTLLAFSSAWRSTVTAPACRAGYVRLRPGDPSTKFSAAKKLGAAVRMGFLEDWSLVAGWGETPSCNTDHCMAACGGSNTLVASGGETSGCIQVLTFDLDSYTDSNS